VYIEATSLAILAIVIHQIFIVMPGELHARSGAGAGAGPRTLPGVRRKVAFGYMIRDHFPQIIE
jgi:hypothetical protein